MEGTDERKEQKKEQMEGADGRNRWKEGKEGMNKWKVLTSKHGPDDVTNWGSPREP